jgi:hypothetical protein
MHHARIHRHSTGPQGALVNAYLVETPDGVVAVDGRLTVSDGRALRSRLDELGRPLLARPRDPCPPRPLRRDRRAHRLR